LVFFKDLEDYCVDRGVNVKDVLKILELSICEGIKSQYSVENIYVEISKTYNIVRILENLKVVEDVRDYTNEISVEEAKEIKEDCKIGDIIQKEAFFPDIERMLVKKVKDMFSKRINFIERDIQYEEFKDKVGTVSSYIVKGIEFGNIILDMVKGEGLLRKEDLIPGEKFQIHDRVKAIISSVSRRDVGFQINLSRTSNDFLIFLLKDSIPEIAEGSIEIKSMARVPGKKSKIAVSSTDPRLDPIAACVGVKGIRINSTVKEINGERIDVVLWSEDLPTFIVNAMSPAEVSKIVIDGSKVTVVVPKSQLSLAIGVGGVNIKLASKLTKHNIKILSEDQHSENKENEINDVINKFTTALEIDEIMARFLAIEGLKGFNDIIEIDPVDLSQLDGFDEDIANELQRRAKEYLNNKCKELGISDDLQEFFVNKETIIKIVENDSSIKSLSAFADLSSDEFMEIIGDSEFTEEKANDMILNARKKLGWLDE
jgi:transcription termination/antitermination protein NusA